MKPTICLSLLFIYLNGSPCTAQTADSAAPRQLPEVAISSYPSPQSLQTTPAAVSLVDSTYFRMTATPGLVPVMNLLPGVRMEERSPGSYRFSIRGSLLRSPFGVRNVKVYIDDFPLTDGGGNTYLNAVDLPDNSRAEVLKGPDGSLFGANTGGVLRLQPGGMQEAQGPMLSVGTGSYGLFTERANGSFRAGRHLVNLFESYQRSDGYRDHSRMHRAFAGVSDKWSYTRYATLKALVFYSDLYYQTPGGLTLQQMQEDPAAARPATAITPSATAQQAAVYTKLLFAGISHEIQLGRHFRQVLDLYGNATDFRNPFITNYEIREEQTAGVRTYLEWHDAKAPQAPFHWHMHAGAEWTQTQADIHNYDNNGGVKGNLQAADDITSRQYFFFYRLRTTLYQRLTVEAALSRNYAGYDFHQSPALTDRFRPQWMPRLAASLQLSDCWVVRGSVSKGYSTPTTAEVRPSDNRLYLDLQPEQGWNYETGLRFRSRSHRILAEAAVFHYRLQQAIVRHLDDNGAEFFTNAGGTRQTGIETKLSWQLPLTALPAAFLQSLYLFDNTTWNAFYFSNYKQGDSDYTGNRLTGVPAFVNAAGLKAALIEGFFVTAVYNHTARLPLDDANSVYAGAYNLVQLQAGKRWQAGHSAFTLSCGVDNLLNEVYSLGNDINAAGGRYYNPAARRNWTARLQWQW